MAKQTVKTKKTVVRISVNPKKSSSGSSDGSGNKRCPTCGKFMSSK